MFKNDLMPHQRVHGQMTKFLSLDCLQFLLLIFYVKIHVESVTVCFYILSQTEDEVEFAKKSTECVTDLDLKSKLILTPLEVTIIF